jgi:hypothetical protein
MLGKRWFLIYWIVLGVFWIVMLAIRPSQFGLWGHSTWALAGIFTSLLGIINHFVYKNAFNRRGSSR